MTAGGTVQRFVKRLRFRDKTLDHLGALLLYYPSGRQFTKDFPGLRRTIRAHCDAGVAPESSALQIAVGILERFLRQLSADERAAVVAALAETDLEALGALAAKRMAQRKVRPGDGVTFATQLSGVAIFMARRMAETGALRREEFQHLLNSVEAALRAQPADGETTPQSPLAAVFGLDD